MHISYEATTSEQKPHSYYLPSLLKCCSAAELNCILQNTLYKLQA